jgi:cytochrome c oxidase cbb3-type subunit 4
MISGLVTAALLLLFIGIAVWAWSARNRERFAEAARLPLEDDAPLDLPAHRDTPIARGAGES